MAGYLTEHQVIEAYITANWTTTNVFYENTVNRNKGDAWVRVTILNAKSRAMHIGDSTPLNEYPGIIDIAIFVKGTSGKETALGYADTFVELFKYKSLGTNIITRDAYIDNTPSDNNTSGWYQVNVSSEFSRREV